MSASLSIADPVNPNTQVTVDPTNAAARASLRPLDHAPQGQTQGGHYRASLIVVQSGTVAGYPANSIFMSLKWTSTNMLFVLKRIRASMVCTTTIATAIPDFQFFKYRGATTAPSGVTGETTFAPATGQKNRTSNMANSQNINCRYLNAAGGASPAGLTAENGKSNEAQPFATGAFVPIALAAPTGAPQVDFYNDSENGGHPFVLGFNEGIEGQFITAQGTTTVCKFYLDIEWAEVAVL